MEYYSALKNEVLIHSATQMSSENTLSEICETQTDKYMISLL